MKYAQGYEECLKEIARRKNHSKKVQEFILQTNDNLIKQREIEISKRLSFRRSFGDSIIPKLMPFLMKSEEEEEKSLPLSTININTFDNDLPDVEVENIEDEFSLVVVDNPTERVKTLEKENAFLNDRLSLLLKNSTNHTDTQNNVRSYKRVQEVEKEISDVKDKLDKEKKLRNNTDKENNELRKKFLELNNSYEEKMKKLEDDIRNYEGLINTLVRDT